MNDLLVYRALSAVLHFRYRYKIMLVAFIGTHIPLLALIGHFLQREPISLRLAVEVLGVALVATLIGTALTLFTLDQLLRPILKTSRALRAYATRRTLLSLPTHYTDEVGTLMADAARTLGTLDATLSELASFDQVTGLPNREKLLRDLNEALTRPGARVALCVVALRNYDTVASAFGQQATDALIRHFARAFEWAVGAGVSVARVAPHQFAFRTDGSDPDRVVARAESVLRALRREIGADWLRFLPQLGCGVALYPEDATDAAGLVNSAVNAVATAASHGASEPVFFSPARRDAARRRLSLEQELRQALEDNQLVLHFQPVVDVSDSRVVAAEALIRWRHPVRGLLLPSLFMPVAEASHAGRGDQRASWGDRAVGAANRLAPVARLVGARARRHQAGGQPLGQRAPWTGHGRADRPHAGLRPGGPKAPGDRGHGDRGHDRPGAHAAGVRPTTRPRRRHHDRRLRHRVLQPELSPEPARRQAEDRPRVRQRH